jgi:hypothetical protein
MLLCLPAPAVAVSLFGVDIASAQRNQLRAMVKRSGAKLVREGGDQLFDEYDSSGLLDGSRTLYLGFERGGGFAFLEYELLPHYQRWMQTRLARKYGEPQVESGIFLSDARAVWQVDGIEISLQRDFDCFCSRLIYAQAANLATLRSQHERRGQQSRDRQLDAQSQFY